MMNLSRRDQILLIFLIAVSLMGVGFYCLIYLPLSQEIQTFTESNQQLQMEKERLQVQIKKGLVKTEDTEDEFAYLNKRLPTEDEMIPLLTMLDKTVGKYKLPFVSLDYKGAEKADATGVQTLVFTISTRGKMMLLLDFLNDLENAERIISVEDVSFNAVKVEKEEPTEKVEAEVGAETELGPPAYYIAPPGIPEAKLQRVKFEVAEKKESTTSGSAPAPAPADIERPVAESFIPDSFEMKVTIKTYYAPSDKVASTGNAAKKNNAQKTKGEV